MRYKFLPILQVPPPTALQRLGHFILSVHNFYSVELCQFLTTLDSYEVPGNNKERRGPSGSEKLMMDFHLQACPVLVPHNGQ